MLSKGILKSMAVDSFWGQKGFLYLYKILQDVKLGGFRTSLKGR